MGVTISDPFGITFIIIAMVGFAVGLLHSLDESISKGIYIIAGSVLIGMIGIVMVKLGGM